MMIEQRIKEYLEKKLNIPVRLMYPEKRPKTFVVIQRMTGGDETNFLASAPFSIASIAPSLFEAMKLDHQIFTAMRSIADGENITGIHYDGGGNWTDPTSGQYRYRSHYTIRYYEEDM